MSATDRRLVSDKSRTGPRPVGDQLHQVAKRSPRGRRPVADQSATSPRSVADQSPTSRRPTAKPSCDSSATSAIDMNFGRGEVAERLQCMSDWGLSCYLVRFYSWYYFAVVSAVRFFCCFIMSVLHDTFHTKYASSIIYLLVELSSSSCINVFCAWHIILYIITLQVDSAAVFAQFDHARLGFWYRSRWLGISSPSMWHI